MPRRLVSVLAAAAGLCAGAAAAQEFNTLAPRDCDWRASAEALVEPWEETSRTFANGEVRIALLDTIEPAAGAFHLLILSPPYGEMGERQCRVISRGSGIGWAGIGFSQLKASYDPARGLVFVVRAQYYDPETSFQNPMRLEITLRQDTGAITVREFIGPE